MEFPFHIYSYLAKKGEIKMKSMNLFGGNDKSNTSKENTKPKETTNQLPPAPIQDEEGNLTFQSRREDLFYKR